MWSSCNSHTLLMGMQFGTTTLGKALAIFMKLNICLFFDTVIQFLSIYLREVKAYVDKNTWQKCL